MRDGGTCQYCGQKFGEKKLTIDHIQPVSRGGKHEWANVVAACSPCNNKKGNRTPNEAKMPLLTKPARPRWLPSKDFHTNDRWPSSWTPYLHRLVSTG